MYPVPPHWPHCVCTAPEAELVLAIVELALVAGALDEGAVDTGAAVVDPEGALPSDGPAILVVIEPDSMKIPLQNQSSGSASVPPFGNLSCPTCQSAEFVEVDALTALTTCLSSSEPVEAQSPTVLALKSMSYAKLYHVLASNSVDHCVTPPTSQRKRLSVVPDSPEIKPYLISVKWL